MPNFVKWSIGCKDIKIFFIFQDGGRPPSWICLGAHITLQKLVMIDAVVFVSRLRIDVHDNVDDYDNDNA